MSAVSPRTAGVVLAAGRSTRMGSPKSLLTIDGTTFLERTIDTLVTGGCGVVYCVLPPANELRRASTLAAGRGAIALENPDRESEPIDSVRIAVPRIADDCGAVVVLPVDHPCVSPNTVAALIDAWAATSADVVRPMFDGRAGHPVAIARSLWPAITGERLQYGLRSLIRGHAGAVHDVVVSDPGTRIDIDTPADYQREVGV